MLDFQFLKPLDNYLETIKLAKVYAIFDIISVENGTPDDLLNALTKKLISKEDKFFIFDHYLFIKDYQDQCAYTAEFLLNSCYEYKNEFKEYQLTFENKNKVFNYQMNSRRETRVLSSCYLKNTFYDKVDFIYSQPWEVNHGFTYYTECFISKHNLNLSCEFLEPHWFSYNNLPSHLYRHGINNAIVFKNCLKENMFDPCAITIVHEPIEYDLGNCLTEKYINAIYGGTIPIILGYKVYETLEKMGFETFSDIIDISSQDEIDPKLRVIQLLDKNKHILNNDALKIIKEKKIQDRIKHNLDILRDSKKLREAIIKINKPNSYSKYLDIISNNEKLQETYFFFNEKMAF